MTQLIEKKPTLRALIATLSHFSPHQPPAEPNRNIPRLETHLTRTESARDPLLIATKRRPDEARRPERRARVEGPLPHFAILRLLSREECGPEGAVVVGYEIGFLCWQRREETLESAGQRVETLPGGDAGTVGRAELGEVGPVVLHGAGKLELCGAERRA